MLMLKTLGLFLVTAIAEITVGCPTCGSGRAKSARLLLPAAASPALFALVAVADPTAAGRGVPAYGGHIVVALSFCGCGWSMASAPRPGTP